MTRNCRRWVGARRRPSNRDSPSPPRGTASTRAGGGHGGRRSVKILITGPTGLLGQALSRRLAPLGEVVGLSRHAVTNAAAHRHVVCDLLNAQRTAEVLREISPEAVIHTQAQSDVDRCELEPAEAHAQNVETTMHVVEAIRHTSCWLMYVSTDYVFDGKKGSPYNETDEPHPISVYGRTKLEAERC